MGGRDAGVETKVEALGMRFGIVAQQAPHCSPGNGRAIMTIHTAQARPFLSRLSCASKMSSLRQSFKAATSYNRRLKLRTCNAEGIRFLVKPSHFRRESS